MSDAPDQVAYWYGKAVADMTREDLLVAFLQLARLHKRQSDERLRQLSVLGEFREARSRL